MTLSEVEWKVQALDGVMSRWGMYTNGGVYYQGPDPIIALRADISILREEINHLKSPSDNTAFNQIADNFYSQEEFRTKLTQMIKDWESKKVG